MHRNPCVRASRRGVCGSSTLPGASPNGGPERFHHAPRPGSKENASSSEAAESSSVGGAVDLSANHESETKGPSGGSAKGAGAGAGGTGNATKAGDANTKSSDDAKEDDPAKPGMGIAQIGLSADSSSQQTSSKSGSGNVNVQQNAKSSPPAPAKK